MNELLMKHFWMEGEAAVAPYVPSFFSTITSIVPRICWPMFFLAWHLMLHVLQLVTHISRHRGNDVVHRGMNISFNPHLGRGSAWLLFPSKREVHKNSNKESLACMRLSERGFFGFSLLQLVHFLKVKGLLLTYISNINYSKATNRLKARESVRT